MPKPKKKDQQGNPIPPDDDDDDGGDELTEGQVSRITDIVNAAVSGQLSRKMGRAITDAVEGAVAPLRELIEKRATGDDGGDGDGGDDGQQQPQRGKGKGAGNARPTKDPEFEAMQKRVAAMEAERKKEREESRNGKRDSMLREQLEAAGVDKNRIRGAVAVLRDSMKYDEKANEWVYKAKREGYEEDVDLEVGVTEWAGTDEGKSYLAPPQPSGGPPRGGSGVRPAGGAGGAPRLTNGGRPAQDPKAAKVAAKQAAVQNLSQAIGELGGATIPIG